MKLALSLLWSSILFSEETQGCLLLLLYFFLVHSINISYALPKMLRAGKPEMPTSL